jgi:hypothetical protein
MARASSTDDLHQVGLASPRAAGLDWRRLGASGMPGTVRNDIGNLSLELTSFVDGDDQASEVKARLATARLVTLKGMGGVGK